jgi:hypothetical protein
MDTPATYVRNIFLNWLVLISWLAAAMMAPRLYLAAVLLPPEGWTGWANYQQALGQYHIAMNVLLGVSFILVAVGMAYADRRCSFHWQRRIPAESLPLVPATSARPCRPGADGMVGPAFDDR